MPASGVVAGLLARCDRGGVWRAMPTEETALKGNLAPLVDINAKQAIVLNRAGVNAFMRTHPGAAVLQGNVSFAGSAAVASMWQKLGVARLTSFVLRSIERHTRWVFGAERTDELAADLERQVWIFLSRLQQNDALVGKTPEQAFFVRTSSARPSDSAPADDVSITLRIGFAPERANELLTYDFRYHERSMTTEVVVVPHAESHLG
jgi:hypothetical protein